MGQSTTPPLPTCRREGFRYKLLVAYDGTDYCGWQIQPNGRTIQGELEKALFAITRQDIKVTGSGRTDSGVHADCQIAHCTLFTPKTPYELMRGINAHLDHDIRVKEVQEVPLSFHARFSTKEKTYLYRVHTKPYQNPFMRKYALHFPHPLDLEMIKQALPLFEGKRNFKAFANEGGPSEKGRNPVKNLKKLTLIEHSDGFDLSFTGDGFLYKMVRNITGTLLDIGRGKILLSDVEKIFQGQDRKQSGRAAPAEGLTLMQVEY